jgi:hypothetical protein
MKSIALLVLQLGIYCSEGVDAPFNSLEYFKTTEFYKAYLDGGSERRLVVSKVKVFVFSKNGINIILRCAEGSGSDPGISSMTLDFSLRGRRAEVIKNFLALKAFPKEEVGYFLKKLAEIQPDEVKAILASDKSQVNLRFGGVITIRPAPESKRAPKE